VTYQTPAGTYYHVTYSPNGSYTYVANSSPSVLGAYSPSPSGAANTGAPSVQGAYGTTTYSPGISSMPRTGGGQAPGLPILPVLAGLAMIGLGAFTRKIALGRL
jgi:hypothetical protein